MKILENLPSIPSSIFSRKDIELFDKYRKEYRRFAGEIKIILNNVSNIYEYDKLLSKFKGSLESINFLSITNSHYYRLLFTYPDESINKISSRILKSHVNFNKMMIYNHIVTAFYIPEDIEQFKLYIRHGKERILIAHYKRSDDKITEKSIENLLNQWKDNSDLENLLERSKELPFLDSESSRQNKLETILLSSKKGLILRNKCGEESIDIFGIKYIRIPSPVQPVLYSPDLSSFSISAELIFQDRKPDYVKFYTETIILPFKQNYKIFEREKIFIGKIKNNYILYKLQGNLLTFLP